MKDRIYLHMIERAEERGELRPGMTIMECTTGNAGIACSAVAAIKGYPCTIVMPEGMSEERRKMLRAYGAELVLTPGGGTDIDLALERMREIRAADPDRYFVPAEFEARTTSTRRRPRGRRSGNRPGATTRWSPRRERGDGSAVRARVKAHDSSIRAYAVEPAECPLISEQGWGNHGVPGIGDGIVPRNLDLAAMDGIVVVSTWRRSAWRAGSLVRKGCSAGHRRGATWSPR